MASTNPTARPSSASGTCHRCGAATPEHHVDERTAGAPVPVVERMDRLELHVDERRLDERGEQIVAHGPSAPRGTTAMPSSRV
jgi:hypothetical protein